MVKVTGPEALKADGVARKEWAITGDCNAERMKIGRGGRTAWRNAQFSCAVPAELWASFADDFPALEALG
jgi:hypothetical protein